jgi:hypothetical protein
MAPYADSLLAKDEVVVHRERQHWLSLILDSRVTILLWAVAAIMLILVFVLRLTGNTATITSSVALVSIVLGLIVLAYRYLAWRSQEFVITDHRLLKVTGIINKRSGDSSLEKINDAILQENVLGRILGYGDLDILTAADLAVDRYRMLNSAKEFRAVMLGAKRALERGGGVGFDIAPSPLRATPVAAPAGADAASAASHPQTTPATPDIVDSPEEVAAALIRLAKLRDSGALTSQEYETKKEELLGRL